MIFECKVCGKTYGVTSRSYKNSLLYPNTCSKECFLEFLHDQQGKNLKEVFSKRLYLVETYPKSGYEEEFKRFLTDNGVKHVYEPYKIELPSGKIYIPDFYIPYAKVFIEVKGVWESGAYPKVVEYRKTFGDAIPLYLLDRVMLRRLGVIR